jgi:hypothetical protein
MTGPDEIMTAIGAATEAGHRGDRAGARQQFAQIWSRIGPAGDPLHVCALAHSMADVQDDPREELVWDLRALDAADSVTEERAQAAGVTGTVAGFYPSLHLNIGEAYRKIGDLDAAREHLALGEAAVDALEDSPYGAMIRRGLAGLADRLDV